MWKLCTEARVALAELKQVGELIPNQSVLINTIPLLEAQASSEIENIVTTSDQLFRFADGNGRTGRLLNILYLVDQQLLTLPVLYLSRHIIHNKADYYRLLLDVTRNNHWQAWITFMLTAVKETAHWTTAKIHAVRQLQEQAVAYVRQQRPTIYSQELVDQIFIQPYCRIGNLVDAGIGHRETSSKYLKALCDIGMLQEVKVGREKLFVHTKLLQLLTTDRSKKDSNQWIPYGDQRQNTQSKQH
ncbi:MAG: hypothetical protein L3K24_17090 [Gammaproteobacteria bacterium]|nr:hypothetical protein [Gammaproteobacteria bacterium]